MALLLKWTTNSFICQVAGEKPEIPPFVRLPAALIRVERGKIEVNGHPALAPGIWNTVQPLFVEQQTYRVSIRWMSAQRSVRLTGGSPIKLVGFQDLDRSEFELNFGSSVGLASLQVGSPEDSLTFEVLPRKIDYRTDYGQMKLDISNQAHSLAFNALGRTEEFAHEMGATFPAAAETHAIAKILLRELIRLLDLIDEQPNKVLRSTERIGRIDSARRITADTWKWQVRRGDRDYRTPALVRKNEPSLATPEHEFIKWTLMTTLRRLVILVHQLTEPGRHGEPVGMRTFIDQVFEIHRAIRNRIQRGVFAEIIARPPATRRLSLVFQLHPLYRRVYHLCLMLLSGLQLQGSPFRMGMKDLPTIYEYWCFLTIVRILRRHATIESQSLVKVERHGATLVLAQGKESIVRLRRSDGVAIEVSYNPIMSIAWTTPQQPDAVVEIRSDGTRLILDAKYRLAFHEDYVKHYGGPGPTEDDINTMHRYRDAILFGVQGHLTKAKEAVALFPLPSSVDYAGVHKLHRSLDTVGVGGIPCHPSNLVPLEDYLVARLGLSRPASVAQESAR